MLISVLIFSYCEKSIACVIFCSWLKRTHLSEWDFEHIASLPLTSMGRHTTWPQARTEENRAWFRGRMERIAGQL